MSRPKILICTHYLEIGGAERALLGLLNALDTRKVDVDLFINQHTGEFMDLVPDNVNLLPENPKYSCMLRPIKDIVREGHWGIAWRRLMGKREYAKYLSTLTDDERAEDESVYQYIFERAIKALPSLENLGEYDLAISFLQPHNIVAEKVKAKKKICWIHTDYSTIHVNKEKELPIWNSYDHIVSISDDCTKAFAECFPELEHKIIRIENILSPKFIRVQSELECVESEIPQTDDVKILSVGRFCRAKRYEVIPEICRIMLDMGLKFKWYIIGFGDDGEIRRNIDRFDVGDTLIILGKKTNPYPYIKACDVYAQPSLYEGKSVTVREAQILGKPVVITDYPTSRSQIEDGVDGKIVPMAINECASGIVDFVKDRILQERLIRYLSNHDYGNESEVQKIYELLQTD